MITRTRFVVRSGVVHWLAVLADGVAYAATAPSLASAVAALADVVARHPTAPCEAPEE